MIVGAVNSVEGKAVSAPSHQAINEKIRLGADDTDADKDAQLDHEIKTVAPHYDNDNDTASDDVIIITGTDAATHLLPLRDDGQPAVTFRSLLLATCLSAFQAVMSQIYSVRWNHQCKVFRSQLTLVPFI